MRRLYHLDDSGAGGALTLDLSLRFHIVDDLLGAGWRAHFQEIFDRLGRR